MALQLLEEGLYDFCGTDAHHQRHLSFLETINHPKTLKLLLPLVKKNEVLL